jgi:hypothetical protein
MAFLWLVSRVAFDSHRIAKITGFAMFILVICGDEFDAADAALNDQMDALVPQFAASNAKFVEDYNNARIIVDSGGGKAKAKTPTPKPPTP